MEKLVEEMFFTRISRIEQHLINLIVPIQGISQTLKEPDHLKEFVNLCHKPLTVNYKDLTVSLEKWTENLEKILEKFLKDFTNFPIQKSLDEIKFIGKRLHEIECHIREIKQDGIKKKIHIDLTMDGYEMVKKTTNSFMESFKEGGSNNRNDQEIAILNLLKTLPDRDQFVVIHRVGLFGEKPKTYVQIEEKYKINRERASKIFKSAIVKLRHSSRKNLVKRLTHKELKDLILGD